MSWFANLPVQRKLGYAMMLTSMGALMLACAVFLAVEYIGYRRSFVRTIATLARITADNSTAAIAFSDNTGARLNLEALRAEPQIIAATLYDADGRVFARYSPRAEEMLRGNPADVPGVHLKKGYVVAVQPVVEGSRRLGTLLLQATMEQIYGRMRTYALVVLGVLASAFGLAGLIASVLRRAIARPILELANTAGAISANQDYSLRARQYGGDELGQLTVTFNAMLDKTQAALRGLRESEWAHRELVRALPTAAYMCDARGLITIYNEAAASLWGRTPEIGREYWCGSHRIYRPDGAPLPLDQCSMSVALREGRPVRGEEIIIERPDGTRRNVLPHPEPVRDTAGALVGIVNMLVDITEQKRADAAVRQLAAIVESSDDAIIGKDLNGIVTTWNRAAEALFGHTAAQMIGQPISRLIPPENLTEEPRILERIGRGESIEQYETVRQRQDGTRLDVSLTVSPIRDSGGRIIGASKIARDITERKRAEAALRDARARQEATLSAAEIGTWILDLAKNRVTADKNMARMMGLPPNDSSSPFEEYVSVIHPEDRARVTAEMNAALTSGEFESDYRLAPPGGEVRWFAARGRVQRNPEGQPTHFPGVLVDITARKRAEAVSEGQRRVLQLIVEDAPLARVLDELVRTVELSASGRMFGSVLLLGEGRLRHGAAPNLPAAYNAAIDGVSIGPDMGSCGAAAWSKEPVYASDLATDPRWANFRDLALRHGLRACWSTPILSSQDEVLGTFAMYYPEPREPTGADLNIVELATRTAAIAIENKRGAAALRTSEAQLRLVTDNAPVLLVRTDRQHRYTFVNRAYAERNGFKPAEMLGMSVAEAVGQTAYEAFKPQMDEALAGARVEFEMEVPYARLGRRWIHVIYVPERDAEGKVTGLLAVITDMGARKQAELELKRARDEALEASRAKDDFLAALSHELRTPLNPVLLLASDAANNPDLPPAIRADFELIRKNVDLEARLIDDLLDLTRITRGKLQLDQHPCDVHTVLQDALANVQPDLLEKRLQLQVDFGANPSSVPGDSVRLQQIFWNILKNAVKFTPENGGISIATRRPAGGDRLTIKIADTGIGMTPEEIGRAFQAFTQGDHSTSGSGLHRFGGLGLGLAITKMLVDLHAGQIQAFSEGRDRGASFVVELPLCQPQAAKTNSASPPSAARPPAGSAPPVGISARRAANGIPPVRRRILLVEDHAPTRLTLQQLLRHRQFEVTTAESAKTAHQLALTGEFDLVISDVGLPDRSGYELMADLRSLNPRLAGIALSGYGMEEDLVRSRAAGFSAHLVKPVAIGTLEDAIASLPPVPPEEQTSHPPRP